MWSLSNTNTEIQWKIHNVMEHDGCDFKQNVSHDWSHLLLLLLGRPLRTLCFHMFWMAVNITVPKGKGLKTEEIFDATPLIVFGLSPSSSLNPNDWIYHLNSKGLVDWKRIQIKVETWPCSPQVSKPTPGDHCWWTQWHWCLIWCTVQPADWPFELSRLGWALISWPCPRRNLVGRFLR